LREDFSFPLVNNKNVEVVVNIRAIHITHVQFSYI